MQFQPHSYSQGLLTLDHVTQDSFQPGLELPGMEHLLLFWATC